MDVNQLPHRLAENVRIETIWPHAPPSLQRMKTDVPILIKIIAPTALRVWIESDLQGSWQEYPAREIDAGLFEIRLSGSHPGGFDACVAVEFPDGIYWDHAGPVRLIIDPSWINDARIYTMIPTASGSITDWIHQLDEIEALGYNVIHLLPVTQMGASASPYAAADLMHVDHRYRDNSLASTADEQFEAFVQELEKRHLRLCIDLVFNHVGLEGAFIESHPDWIIPDFSEPDHFKRAGWWCGSEWMKWDDVALLDFDHWHPPTKAALWSHLLAYARHWAQFAARTGGLIRLDNLHSTHPGLLAQALPAIRREFPNLTILAELFTDTQEIDRQVCKHGLNLLLATPWEHHFTPDLRWYLREIHDRMPQVRHFVPMASHDSGSPNQMYGNPLAAVPRLAISAFFGLGTSGSVQGMEYGIPKGIPFIGFTDPQISDSVPDFRDHVRTLNALHAKIPELREAGNIQFVDGDHHAVLAATRSGTTSDSEHFVAANMDLASNHQLDLSWLPPGEWTDLISGQTISLATPIPVEAAGYRILKRIK